MVRKFKTEMYRGDELERTVILTDPHLRENWNNAVTIIRWVIGALMGGDGYLWTEFTLVPQCRGTDGVWSACDMSGRLYRVVDLDFKQ